MKSDNTAPMLEASEAGTLPDVGGSASPLPALALDAVGMQGIAVPLLVDAGSGLQQVAGRVAAGVSLAAGASRGIHMSRLYRQAGALLSGEPLSVCSLHKLLHGFLDSHQGLADHARVRLGFDLLLKRNALLSEGFGWQRYPIALDAQLERGQRHCRIELGVTVTYSSTCPASAALARQAIQQAFATRFAGQSGIALADAVDWLGSEDGVPATPHSQRSEARVKVLLAAELDLPFLELIERVEQALATPVQTAVKREDEQEFARLNGRNAMFCEDAARRIHRALDDDARFADFRVRAIHYESLHAHDAVAVATKGVAGGYGDASRPD